MGIPLGKKMKILIVDDHAMVRDGVKFQLSGHQDLEICGEAESVDDAFAMVKQACPDLVIIDISLKSGHGLDLVKKIQAYDRNVKMLVVTMYKESLYAERSLRAGAHGFLNKQESREKLVQAVRAVLAGERYLSRHMTDRLVGQAVGDMHAVHASPVETLTNRELQVFQLIGEGLTTGVIAKKLHLSPHTIDTHREKIKNKLGLQNSGELQREAVQWVLENG
jgi:DNA-binding NarL/FixJ family response regulator